MTLRTEEKLQELELLYNQGLTDRQMVTLLSASNPTIGRWRRQLGLPRHPPSPTNSIYQINEDFFQNIDMESKAYWLGFIYADGNIHDDNEYTKCAPSWKFSLGVQWRDADHMESFLRAIESTHPLNKKDPGNSNRQPFAYVSIYRQRFAKHLISHGVIPRKTDKLQFPQMPSSLIPHFIRGVLDGDGCIFSSTYNCVKQGIRNNYKVLFYSSAKSFLVSIAQHLHYICDVPVQTIALGTRCYRLGYHGRLQVLKIIHVLYDNAHIFLPRKYNLAQSIFETEPGWQLPLLEL